MKRIVVFVLSLSLGLLISGCQGTKSKAVEGGVIGGVLGAAAGGIIGHQSGRGGKGAAIGAAVGAISGTVVGSQMPKSSPGEQETASTLAAQSTSIANPNQISIQQIVDFAKQGVHEDVVIDKIRLTNSKFNLSNSDIAYLRQQGVSEKVINAMQ